jgi:hypothetical protein
MSDLDSRRAVADALREVGAILDGFGREGVP